MKRSAAIYEREYDGGDYSEEEEEDEENEVFLPIVLTKGAVSKEKYVSSVGEYISSVSKIACFVSTTYAKCVSGTILDLPERDVKFLYDEMMDVHDALMSYGFVHSQNANFKRVFPCKTKGEDVLRKTSLRSHLFWETCKARWCVKIMRALKNTEETSKVIGGGGDGGADSGEHADDDIYYEILEDMGICPYPERDVETYSQRELGQAFFMLSAHWKTMDYVPTLSEYVNKLVDRMCDFFCYSMNGEEMDDENLRQPIPDRMLPRFEVEKGDPHSNKKSVSSSSSFFSSRSSSVSSSKWIPSSSGGDRNRKFSKNNARTKGIYDDEHEHDDHHEGYEGPEDTTQYAPTFDYVMMCQMRMFNFLKDLSYYEDREKRDMRKACAFYRAKCVRIKNSNRNACERYDCTSYLNTDILKRHVVGACENIAPEQKERTASKFVYGTFSETDKEWLVYKQPINLPSYADEFISKECKGPTYSTEVVEKTRQTYAQMLKGDVGDDKLTGFYEWCVLKNASRLFALEFDLFQNVIYNREEIADHATNIFSAKQPLIVQFFSRYYVFYAGKVITDDPNERNPETEPEKVLYVDYALENEYSRNKVKETVNACTVYDTLLLWIYIMLCDFPDSEKSKGIENRLKTKFAEYNKLEEQERLAAISGIRREKRSRIQMEDEEDLEFDVGREGRLRERKNAEDMEMEENEGISERQNVHDWYFDQIVNLNEDELKRQERQTGGGDAEKQGLFFF